VKIKDKNRQCIIANVIDRLLLLLAELNSVSLSIYGSLRH